MHLSNIQGNEFQIGMRQIYRELTNRMSLSSGRNGPLVRLSHNNSDRSLYTENSNGSESPKAPAVHLEEEPVSKKINVFPLIAKQPKPAPQKVHKPSLIDSVPKIPQFGPSEPLQQPFPINARFNQSPGSKTKFNSYDMNTIAVTQNIEPLRQNTPLEHDHPYRMSGISGISGIQPNADDRSRMLRSSQGGRWFRSQSLMQDKNKKSSEFLIKNYHRNGSKFGQKFDSLLRFHQEVEKMLGNKKNSISKYKISLYDSLEEIKNKMENYLEAKLDLSNLPIDRPDADWGQAQLMKFYQNYPQILVNRPNLHQDKQEQQQDAQTVLKKYKNCSYFGPVIQGKKNGFGYLHYFSGRFFEGLFAKDQKVEGFEMDDSELYLGQYHKNQRHGEGILKTNDCLISGIFTEGQFCLHTTQGFKKNDSSNPVFGSQEEEATMMKMGLKILYSSVSFYSNSPTVIEKNNNGDVYIGKVNEDNEKHGEGLEIFSNGDVYIGNYEQGAPEGYGEYYWDSGAFYRGDFLSGMRHGKGSWMMLHGDRYDGEYLNDKKNGKGVYLWKSGDRYEGQFQNDYRHGYGQMRWRDGTSYKGNWSNGIEVNKFFKLQSDSNATTDHTESQHVYKGRKVQQRSPAKAIPIASKALPPASKNTFKTIQPRRRIGSNSLNTTSISKHAKGGTIGTQSRYSEYHRVESSQNKTSNQRVPLEKLKAMLNPSNSVN